MSGQAIYVSSGDTLEIYDSAIVNHTGWSGGAGVGASDADVTVRRSVFTNNDNNSTSGARAAITVYATSGGAASLTVSHSIFADNEQAGG